MRHLLVAFSILGLLIALPAKVDAAIVVRAEDVTVVNGPGGVTGFFDVFAEVSAPIPNISGWQLKINLSGNGSDVAFTSAGATAGTHPNVFDPVAPIPVTPMTATMAEVTNLLTLPGASAPLDDQDGFVRIFFAVQPGIIGTYNVTIDAGMSFINDDTTPDPVEMPFTITPGSINVLPVPEPSSVVVWGLIASVLTGTTSAFRRRHAR